MRVLLAASITSLLSLPGVALACGDDGITYYEHYGTPAFGPTGEITAVSPTQHDVYDWVGIANATDPRSARGRIEVLPEMESTGPRIRVGAKHVFVRIRGSLYELDEEMTVRASLVEGITTFDATLDANPVIVTGQWSMEGVPSISIFRRGLGREGLVQQATAAADTCDASKLAIGRAANGLVAGLCGDSPFVLAGDEITVLPPLGIGWLDAVETAGVDADGALTFFASAPSADAYNETKLHAIRLAASGEWTHELVATLPIAVVVDGRLAASSPDAVMIAGFDEYYAIPLTSMRRVDGVWTNEAVAYLQTNDRVAVRGDKVLAGGFSLRSYEKDPQSGTWTESNLGDIGFSGTNGSNGSGCSVTGTTASAPDAALMMMAIAALGLVIAHRQRTA